MWGCGYLCGYICGDIYVDIYVGLSRVVDKCGGLGESCVS